MCARFYANAFKHLYHAEGIAQTVDFKFVAAIRKQSDGQLHCPAEPMGCPSSQYIMCVNATGATSETQALFQICWSTTKGIDSAEEKATKCALETGLDPSFSATCFAEEGPGLAAQAAEYFAYRFPAHAEGGDRFPKYGVPRVDIDGTQMGTDEYPGSYDDLLRALCSRGIQAGACKKMGSSPTSSFFT